jgi:hypothetical protein
MAISKYTRIGLRADKNLDDLLNAPAALANVLDDFTLGETFVPGDLTVINGLSTTNVFASDLGEIVDIDVSFTSVSLDESGNTIVGLPAPLEPAIRVKDTLEEKLVLTGNPISYFGGPGPKTFVVPSSELDANCGQLTSPTVSADDVFDTTNANGNLILPNDYWLDGRFAFSDVFHPSLQDSFGGICWDGYMTYRSKDNQNFFISTNAFYIFEIYDDATTTWTTIQSLTQESVDVVTTGAVSNAVAITVSDSDFAKVFVGMKTTINSAEFEITETNQSTNTITFIPAGSAVDFTLLNGATVTLNWTIGENVLRGPNYFPIQIPYGTGKRYRLTAWYPKPDQFAVNKVNNTGGLLTTYGPFGLLFDGTASDETNQIFADWYPPESKPNDPGITPANYTYENFKRNKLGAGKKDTTTSIENESPVFLGYEPKKESDEITDVNFGGLPNNLTLTWKGDNTFYGAPSQFSISSLDINEGDILLFSGLRAAGQYYLRVAETRSSGYIFTNAFLQNDMSAIMTTLGFSVDDDISFFVIKPKGLVCILTETVSDGPTAADASHSHAGDVILNSVNEFKDIDIRKGDLVLNLGATTGPQYFRRISTDIDRSTATDVAFDSTPIFAGDTSTTHAGGYILIYAHRGLSDQSLSQQCVGVYGKEVTANAVTGDTQITISSTSGVTATNAPTVGDYVQFGTVVPNATRVASVDSATQITLSNPLAAPLNAASTLIFIKDANAVVTDGVVESREVCIIPLNTAPPFAGTDTGLQTTSTHPHLVITGDFEVTGLQINTATVNNLSATSGTNSSSGATANEGLLLKKPTGDGSTLQQYWLFVDN